MRDRTFTSVSALVRPCHRRALPVLKRGQPTGGAKLAGRAQVIGNLQKATFAAFGGFATLILAGFAGTRRDKLIAHAGLAVGEACC